MKKYYTAPALLLLVLSFAACGKTDSATNPAGGGAATTPPPVTGTPTFPGGNTDFATWCQQSLGIYDSKFDICQIKTEKSYSSAANAFPGGQEVDTGLDVYVNNIVEVRASTSVKALIGNYSYNGFSSFYSMSQGRLYLKNKNAFTVYSIKVMGCYNRYQQSVKCY